MKSLYLILLIKNVLTHSWLDCTDRRTDGSCGGYIRNFQGHYDLLSTYKILDRSPEVPLCDPKYQSVPYYKPEYPMAKVKSGQTLYFDYFENGHVNLDRLPPDFKPHPNIYSVYLNRKSYLGDLNDGSQYLKRKDLFGIEPLIKAPFDDGECSDITYFNRIGPKPCIGNYTIPMNLSIGVYQLIWVWHFDRDNNGKGEEYTSCFDVEVLSDQEYNEKGSSIRFKPYTPFRNLVTEVKVNVEKHECKQGTYDNNLYDCVNQILCEKGNKICNENQCYNTNQFQCCFDKYLLPKAQSCEILANPFERIKGFLKG
ncbi:hypothetical protein K502DRAFT_359995 [Neoconidiobolus thromboides FSU 785]|nr:hypothetical protein K502DRAFT_359995 [Neoconidiobolus thromboides FSU 785]